MQDIFYTATSCLNELTFTPIFSINANNSPKYCFTGFRGVNASKSQEVALNHCGCSLTSFTIITYHFRTFNLNPEEGNGKWKRNRLIHIYLIQILYSMKSVLLLKYTLTSPLFFLIKAMVYIKKSLWKKSFFSA